MKVQVTRSGVTVRAREIFDVKTYEDRNWTARLGSALESPVPATAVGLRVTSYLSADPADADSLRLVLAGDASRLQPGEATLQVVVRDLEGRRIVAGEQSITIPDVSPAPFATHIRVPPGSYLVRLAVQDAAGRVGSVDHRVEARPVSFGSLSVTGPMLVQVTGAGQGEPSFTVDGVPADARLALEVGLQGDGDRLASADIVFEIAASADGPALIEQPASLSPAGRQGSIVAQAVADVRVLPPGQYLARVRLKSGEESVGEVRRSFAVLERPARAVLESAAGTVAVAPRATLPASIRGRAAAAVPPFAVRSVLAPHVLGGFLERVAARPEAASPAAGDLLTRARAGNISELNVSEAQAAQTPVAAFLKGLTLLAQNKLNPAGNAFRSAMRASPDFYPAMVYLGACYAAAGNDKEAAAIWRTALIKEGNAQALHLLLTDALLRQGNSDLALRVISAARARWPEEAELKRRFVLASLLAGNWTDGLQALGELVEGREEDEPSLALALLVLYESLSKGRVIDSVEQDRARMLRLADAYRARGGPSLALVEAWVAAAGRR
jgi:tetratricopeptide (TPR) repeat protein